MTAARPASQLQLQLVPVTLAEAKRFVGCHQRHTLPPVTWRFGVGITSAGGLVGVGMAGNPTARKLAQADPYLIEIVRVSVVDASDACSMLYGALCRAAKALGYRRAITYTLATEPGTSLRAAGFTLIAELPASRGWDQPSRRRYQCDLFGNARTPEGPKRLWERELSA